MSKVTLTESFRFAGAGYPADKEIDIPTAGLDVAEKLGIVAGGEIEKAKPAPANKANAKAPKNK